MATVTESLIGKMAGVKKEMSATMRFMAEQTKEVDAKHDEVAAQVADLDEKIAKDPGNEELSRTRDEYDRVRTGLYAASEYGTNLVKQLQEG